MKRALLYGAGQWWIDRTFTHSEFIVCICPLLLLLIYNPLRVKFLKQNINTYLHFVSFLHTNKTQVAVICDVRSQGISSHDIDRVKPS